MPHPIATIRTALEGLDYDVVVMRNHLLDVLGNHFKEVIRFSHKYIVCVGPLDKNTTKEIVVLYIQKQPQMSAIRELAEETACFNEGRAKGTVERIIISDKIPNNSQETMMRIRGIDTIFKFANTWKDRLLLPETDIYRPRERTK